MHGSVRLKKKCSSIHARAERGNFGLDSCEDGATALTRLRVARGDSTDAQQPDIDCASKADLSLICARLISPDLYCMRSVSLRNRLGKTDFSVLSSVNHVTFLLFAFSLVIELTKFNFQMSCEMMYSDHPLKGLITKHFADIGSTFDRQKIFGKRFCLNLTNIFLALRKFKQWSMQTHVLVFQACIYLHHLNIQCHAGPNTSTSNLCETGKCLKRQSVVVSQDDNDQVVFWVSRVLARS